MRSLPASSVPHLGASAASVRSAGSAAKFAHRPQTAANSAPRPRTSERLFLAGWWLTIQTLPFYLWNSGTAQPTDYLLAAVASIPGILSLARLLVTDRSALVTMTAFIGVVVFENCVWAGTLGATDFLLTTAFYVFNATIYLGVLAHGRRIGQAFTNTTASAFTTLLATQAALSFVFPDRNVSGRLTLFFNNPNQLAYFALASATVVALIASVDGANRRLRLYAYVAIGAASWLALRTYSRAGMLGCAGLGFLWIARRPAIALAVLLPALVVAGSADLANSDDELMNARIAAMMNGNASEYLEDRALTRVFEFPQYLIFGAGEGQHIRFNPIGLELHSSLANIAFSYGVLGLVAFGALLLGSIRAPAIRTGLLLPPALFYSLFHNGLRSRVFWIVLAVAMVLRTSATAETPERMARRVSKKDRKHRLSAPESLARLVRSRQLPGPARPDGTSRPQAFRSG